MFTAIAKQNYIRAFTPACAVPFCPSAFVSASSAIPFASLVKPAAATVRTFGYSPILPTIPFIGSMLYSGNIFIQNMCNILAKTAAALKQQQTKIAAYKPVYSNYRFGTLTTPVKNNYLTTGSKLFTKTAYPKKNLSFWERLGYNASSGLRLARTAMSRAVGFVGKCARYVKNAIASCGLGKYVSGNACDMISILRRNKNFREISPAGVDLKSLPAGCILVYGKGVSKYSRRYGHTEITTGNGKAVSDGITNNIRSNVTAIFIPVA